MLRSQPAKQLTLQIPARPGVTSEAARNLSAHHFFRITANRVAETHTTLLGYAVLSDHLFGLSTLDQGSNRGLI